MSEQLLRAIIRLFAILAKADGISEDEKKTIRNFLLERLNEDTAMHYYSLFNQLIEEYERKESKSSPEQKQEEEKIEIEKISNQINNELTQQQKIVLILDVTTLVIADRKITAEEERLVEKIGKAIRVDQQDIESMKAFALANKPRDFDSEIFLIAGPSAGEVPEKAHYLPLPNLDGFLAVLELTHYTGSYFLKYIGSSLVYLNNIPLKSNDMRMIPSGSTIRSANAKTLYYSDIVSSFKKHVKGHKISFLGENIEYRFHTGKIGLRNVNIKEESGTLFGIMGSSGSGKSTLLNVLNGNEKPSSGRVLINEIDIYKDRKKIEGIIGYVPQDDLLMEDLTVYENLYYAAKLCFSNYTESEIDHLVMQTLSNLGLSETRDLKVGSPLDKTISGGQRKRLNIGLELLREPSVMFVDEPTSGLSSRDSENIMDLLKELSLKGKLIFVVIHQPSSEIYKLFDKLVILDEGGYQIYYGNPVEAIIYFKNEFNLVDSDQGECVTCGNVNPEQIFNIIETRVVNEFGRLTKERKVTPQQWHETFLEKIDIKEIPRHEEKLVSTLNIPNYFRQFKVFAKRDLLSKISNKQYLLINLLEAPILAFILAYIVRYFPVIGPDSVEEYFFSTNVNIPAYIFMSVIVALFMGLTVSAEEIIRDRKILKRESFLHLSRGSYIVSKLSILFGLSAIQTLTYTLIGNTILEIQGMFLPFWLILFTTSCFANVLGLNISSAFNSAVTIYILIPILLIPQLLLSGVVVKFDELNPGITTRDKVPLIGETMASRWAFEAAMVTQFKENKFEKPFFNLDKQMGNAEYKNLYFVPTLMSKLDYCHIHYKDEEPEIVDQLDYNFDVLTNEIGDELDKFGYDNLPDYPRLNRSDFNEEVYESTKRFLGILKKVYIRRYNDALKKKEQLMATLTSTPQKRERFEKIKKENHNKRIEDMVKNTNEAIRIIEHDRELIQKIYPIFHEPDDPDHVLDFRTIFYSPTKHLMGRQIETLWFNLGMIWFMSFILVITLYYDVLRWLVQFPDRLKLKNKTASG